MKCTFITSPQEGGWLLPCLFPEHAWVSLHTCFSRRPAACTQSSEASSGPGWSFGSKTGLPKVKHLTLTEPDYNLGPPPTLILLAFGKVPACLSPGRIREFQKLRTGRKPRTTRSLISGCTWDSGGCVPLTQEAERKSVPVNKRQEAISDLK